MNCGLSSETQAKILGVLSDFTQVSEAILYGSRAMGTFKPGSDIDLTLKGDGLNLSVLNQIRTQLDDLLLPYTFDLSIHDQIDNADLLDHIKRVGKVFFSGKKL